MQIRGYRRVGSSLFVRHLPEVAADGSGGANSTAGRDMGNECNELDRGEPDPSSTIDVLKCLRCAHQGCTNVPSWGHEGRRPILCSEHASADMVQVVELRCQEPDCKSRRTYGFDGDAAQYCAAHKLEGMIDLMKRRTQVKARDD